MYRERIIRLIAGSFILLGLGLGFWVDHRWYLLDGFVGLNLFQSSLTGWCLMDDILRVVFHVPSEAEYVTRDAELERVP